MLERLPRRAQRVGQAPPVAGAPAMDAQVTHEIPTPEGFYDLAPSLLMPKQLKNFERPKHIELILGMARRGMIDDEQRAQEILNLQSWLTAEARLPAFDERYPRWIEASHAFHEHCATYSFVVPRVVAHLPDELAAEYLDRAINTGNVLERWSPVAISEFDVVRGWIERFNNPTLEHLLSIGNNLEPGQV